VAAAVLIRFGIAHAGFLNGAADIEGVIVVLGGLTSAMLIHCSFAQLLGSFKTFLKLFMPSSLPTPEECVAEVVRLARKAHKEGGVLSLQDDAREFAGGFLHRAIVVAIASGESDETRKIIEAEVRQLRHQRNEEANVFRSAGVLAPMFGLLGTLLGMVKVLGNMSDPAKAGAAMAVALSSAFLGIAIANFLCVPIAGQVRVMAMHETLIYEILLEGVVDIASGKSPYVVELHLAAYAKEHKAQETGGAVAAGAQA
jgi:chemotaxis protein MotA